MAVAKVINNHSNMFSQLILVCICFPGVLQILSIYYFTIFIIILQNSSNSSDGHTGIALQPNSHMLNSDDERRVNLVVESTPTGFIGFTLRGGAEYGLGIYISG